MNRKLSDLTVRDLVVLFVVVALIVLVVFSLRAWHSYERQHPAGALTGHVG